MTEAQWGKMKADLEEAITRKKRDAQTALTLFGKIQYREEQKVLEEALRQHKLNYYELVTP